VDEVDEVVALLGLFSNLSQSGQAGTVTGILVLLGLAVTLWLRIGRFRLEQYTSRADVDARRINDLQGSFDTMRGRLREAETLCGKCREDLMYCKAFSLRCLMYLEQAENAYLSMKRIIEGMEAETGRSGVIPDLMIPPSDRLREEFDRLGGE
jgi:hypothetical protein